MVEGHPDETEPTMPLGGTRAQAMQRLQVGVFGLASMILLIGLAQIIMNQAREAEARVVPEAAPTVTPSASPTPSSDPLADAGVGPDLPAESQQSHAQPDASAVTDALPQQAD